MLPSTILNLTALRNSRILVMRTIRYVPVSYSNRSERIILPLDVDDTVTCFCRLIIFDLFLLSKFLKLFTSLSLIYIKSYVHKINENIIFEFWFEKNYMYFLNV